ncbi:hypothetical protein Gohar_020459 [Gossypium harknessii]|uniref:Uncharacterized protein n=2 Tax=Gossypium TaxID=3633 RepID=A0A7J8YDY4_GOSAI|nr:hypothetical protein [Gossypium aridum]MBA0814645.1 hypothetical protein [Gossypium harknessii]
MMFILIETGLQDCLVKLKNYAMQLTI